MQFLRFLAVSVLGVGVDLGASWLFATLGAPLWLAASLGFGLAALLNYLLHLRWTFQTNATPAQATRYAAGLGLTYATRIGAVLVIGHMRGPDAPALWVLVPAVGISFIVSFLANKFLVFQNSTQKRDRR